MSERRYSLIDRWVLQADQVIRALTNNVQTSGASYPAKDVEEALFTESERKRAASLMRVNHTGEICAQALYHGQSLVARTPALQQSMQQAALEEGDHLAWCHQRLVELDNHTSYLNPLWYAGSFCIGLVAGMVGDAWSLGFVAETERQVIKHLDAHLKLLPQADVRSYKILQQMEQDEAHHRDEAIANGAKLLPSFIQTAMRLTSKVMVKTAYWI